MDVSTGTSQRNEVVAPRTIAIGAVCRQRQRRAVLDCGGAGVSIGPGQRQRAGAFDGQRATGSNAAAATGQAANSAAGTVGDDAAELGTAAAATGRLDGEVVAAEKNRPAGVAVSGALERVDNRDGGCAAAARQFRNVEDAAREDRDATRVADAAAAGER